MNTLESVLGFLEKTFPPELAEDWDNIGLLIGDPKRRVEKIMTCLTITPETVEEAVEEGADIIITHHPFPFRALKRITSENSNGRMILNLIESSVAVYSPHTAHDNANCGINQQLAERLELLHVEPLMETRGRLGTLPAPVPLVQLVKSVKDFLEIPWIQYVDSRTARSEKRERETHVRKIAIGCGAAGEFLPFAAEKGADAMLIGEARFHTSLEAQSLGISLILPGHYASERFALDRLADRLKAEFPGIRSWASQKETDPITTLGSDGF